MTPVRPALLTMLLLVAAVGPAAAQELPAADSLIATFVEAIGGREVYTSPTSIRTTGTLEVAGMGLSGDFQLLQHAPDRMVLRASLPGVGELVNGFDGEVGWNIDPLTGPRVLTGEELEARAERSSFLAPVRDASLVPVRETVELAEYDGRECWRVRLEWASGRETFDCYSTEDGLLIAAEETQLSQMGMIEVTLIYGEYREFQGGLQFPTEVTQQAMGQTQVMFVDEVEVDTLEPEAFEPPAAIRTLLEGAGNP